MSMKNSSDTIGNRTRDLPACKTVPQPIALPRASTEQWGVRSVLTTIYYSVDQFKENRMGVACGMHGDIHK
jgi:hypothetical protein